jgi:hypothetical protein
MKRLLSLLLITTEAFAQSAYNALHGDAMIYQEIK